MTDSLGSSYVCKWVLAAAKLPACNRPTCRHSRVHYSHPDEGRIRSGLDQDHVSRSFYDQVGHALALGANWGRNLDALDDVLSGRDRGVPDDGFTFKWVHSDVSRANLGYPETAKQLE